jgi:hypothetical protein
MKIWDNERWAMENFGECQLGDARRTKRLVKTARNMLASPEKSIPSQNVEWSDVKAAYRLFDNEQVTFERVAERHWEQTRQTQPGRYLLISDTTDVDHTLRKATSGLGMLGNGGGRGLQLHSCLVYDCDSEVIQGIAGAVVHYRQPKPQKESRTKRLARKRDGEYWGQVVDQVGESPDGSQWIHVFDRGGDNFEAMCHIQRSKNDWVIRAGQLQRVVINSSGESVKLCDALEQSQRLGSYELKLRSRPGVAARTAQMELSVVKVTYPRPRHASPWVKESGIQGLETNVVIVQEVNAPQGVKPIRWVLLTSLPVNTFEEARQVVGDYGHRWLIEEYHKVMKTGCGLERHALRDAQRLEPLIALISIVGVRLFQMKLVGRNQPNRLARTHVPARWLKCLQKTRPKTRKSNMTVYEFFRELAKLGGFLGRKHDGEPGWQTIWQGHQKLMLQLQGMELAQAGEP